MKEMFFVQNFRFGIQGESKQKEDQLIQRTTNKWRKKNQIKEREVWIAFQNLLQALKRRKNNWGRH